MWVPYRRSQRVSLYSSAMLGRRKEGIVCEGSFPGAGLAACGTAFAFGLCPFDLP
jgi:hypothetical protein